MELLHIFSFFGFLESFQNGAVLGRPPGFLESFQNGAVLGSPPGFREFPEMELSWADRLVIGESPNWSCPGQIA